jgi:cell division protein FtsI/penicillin-binding protein 2
MKFPHFSRTFLIGLLLSLVCVVIIAQMVNIQTSSAHKELSEWADQRYGNEVKTIYPKRGSIYDRSGHLLAGNMALYEIGLDLTTAYNIRTIAESFSSILKIDPRAIYGKIDNANRKGLTYVKLIDYTRGAYVSKFRNLQTEFSSVSSESEEENPPSLRGLIYSSHLVRAYPEYDLAANVLGFYPFKEGDNAHGYYGVEGQYDDLLTGQPIQVTISRNPYLLHELPSANPAASLVLTIDREIQSTVEDILDASVEKNGAVSGTVIVEDPETGEILAMATSPRVNLNEYWTSSQVFEEPTRFNTAVGTVYEPGSVFKVLTMASALDKGIIKADTPFLDTGVLNVDGYEIYNWDDQAYGPQTMIGCMQHSLNVCLAWIALQLGPTNFEEYMNAFHIGRPSNIDLAGEAYLPMRIQGDPGWSRSTMATMSFGQGVALAPIQFVMSVSALANDGKMVAPHIVRSIIKDGVQYDVNPQVIGSPIKAETAHTITDMLAQSLEVESSKALVDGYRLAGKTGTAEIPTPYGYTMNRTNASFIGWGPVDDPKFIVYVWLEKPTSSIWGSVVAAPLFRDVVREVVVLMDIPTEEFRQELVSQTQ